MNNSIDKTSSKYYSGLNSKLLNSIPSNAERILELGCAYGNLGRRYKQLHPKIYWHGVDISKQAATVAAEHLDAVDVIDLDIQELSIVGEKFDTIVIGDLLEHLNNPDRVLNALHMLSTADARIVCCAPNMSHFSVLSRMISGDISYDQAGLLDNTHRRFFSPASLFKLFLDTGWLPNMDDYYLVKSPKTIFFDAIIEAARGLGIPESTASLNFSIYQLIITAHKRKTSPPKIEKNKACFSIITPINRAWQYDLNIARSPGILEIGAKIVCIEGAPNAASAFEQGLKETTTPWVVMAHQDVYFPAGTGLSLAQELTTLELSGHLNYPVGFAGISREASGNFRHSGLVIDRLKLFKHAGSQTAESIDELAVALHRKNTLSIDPNLGWHLWATDLCLQTQLLPNQSLGRILEIPIFHNSTNDSKLSKEFHLSALKLLNKYPFKDKLITLCGNFSRS